MLPCHRDMAVLFIRGVPLNRIFAQYMGRTGGLTRGRDGNMHMGDLNLNIISIISALAATVPVATGCAMALRYKGKQGAAAFSYFGDGATSRGDWHEGVNFATVQKLPVLYVCNNNQYAYSTPLHLQMACEHVADKGPVVRHACRDCRRQRRAGRPRRHRPRARTHPRRQRSLHAECKTFRMTGHSAHDGAHYVPKELFEKWEKLDPITRLQARMLEEGWAAQAELDQTRAAIVAEVDEAVAWAENSPWPDPATLLDDVYETQ